MNRKSRKKSLLRLSSSFLRAKSSQTFSPTYPDIQSVPPPETQPQQSPTPPVTPPQHQLSLWDPMSPLDFGNLELLQTVNHYTEPAYTETPLFGCAVLSTNETLAHRETPGLGHDCGGLRNATSLEPASKQRPPPDPFQTQFHPDPEAMGSHFASRGVEYEELQNSSRESSPVGPLAGPDKHRKDVHEYQESNGKHDPILFDSHQRPYSALLHKREPDHDDSLPFETTKNLAILQRNTFDGKSLPPVQGGLVMSKDKFERYKKSLSNLDMLQRQSSVRSQANVSSNDDSDDSGSELSTKQHKRDQARIRQQQEVHFSLHRQKMTKTTGTKPISTSTTMDVIQEDEEDIMENIPLAILRAHGFPKRARPVSAPALGLDASGGPTVPNSRSSDNLAITASPGHARKSSDGGEMPFSSGKKHSVPLPAIFNDPNDVVNRRGLVAAIAKQEDSKIRRRTTGFAPVIDSETTQDELIVLKNQVEALSEQMRAMMGPPQGEQFPVNPTPSMYRARRLSSNTLANPEAFAGPKFSPMRPASVHSFATAPPESPHLNSFAAVQYANSIAPPYANSIGPQYATSIAPQTNSPGKNSIAHAQSYSSMRPTSMYQTRPQSEYLSNRPAQMRMVNTMDDGESSGEDEQAWNALLSERRALRARWKEVI